MTAVVEIPDEWPRSFYPLEEMPEHVEALALMEPGERYVSIQLLNVEYELTFGDPDAPRKHFTGLSGIFPPKP